MTGLWQRVFLFMAVVTGSSKFSDSIVAILSFTLPFYLRERGGGRGAGGGEERKESEEWSCVRLQIIGIQEESREATDYVDC